MKKITVLMLAMIMCIVSFAACSQEKEPINSNESEIANGSNENSVESVPFDEVSSGESSVIEEASESTSDSALQSDASNDSNSEAPEIKTVRCVFREQITPADFEGYGTYFSAADGKVYVDLVLDINNKSDDSMTEEDISGYFTYDGLRYDMQFEVESEHGEGFLSYSPCVKPGERRIVHLICSVGEAAASEPLTVNYKVYGKTEFETITVSEDSSAYTLEEKTELKIGDTVNIEDKYNIEVTDCSVKKYLTASDYANSRQYTNYNGSFFELILKVKNNSSEPLSDISAYTFVDGQAIKATKEIETKNNTELMYLSFDALQPGEEEYIHLYVSVEEGISSEGLAMRVNFFGTCITAVRQIDI